MPRVPPGLVFSNTKQTTTVDEELARTTFYFELSEEDPPGKIGFVSDLGGHVPSREDDLFAPFYPDPSQQVLAVEFVDFVIVTKTAALLGLAQEREGERLQWGEWRSHATRVWRDRYTYAKTRVSGPRLCYAEVIGSEETMVDVYDFGARASAACVESTRDGVAQRFTPSVTKILPWKMGQIITSYGCHNSITFVLVKVSCLSNSTRN